MLSKIRVLAIAPYEAMKNQIVRIAKLYEDIELSVYVGDLELGAEIARTNFHADYDIILSRGGTAKLIQQIVPLPVVEIEISLYDILCAFNLSQPETGRTAIVGFSGITKNAHLLCGIIGIKLDIFTLEDAAMAEPILMRLRAEGYQTVLCDMIANTVAKTLGLNTFLITSGVESIKAAFDQVKRFCTGYNTLLEENHFLRALIMHGGSNIVVFNQSGELFFSTLPQDDDSFGVLQMLLPEIPQTVDDSRRKIMRTRKGNLYTIYAQRFSTKQHTYIAFFLHLRKAPVSATRSGIQILTRKEVEEIFYANLFSMSGGAKLLQSRIPGLVRRQTPIMISGEDSTGKEQTASMLYLHSEQKDRPLIIISCSLLNEKAWDFLFESPNSPLCDEGNTLFFKTVDALSSEMRRQLSVALQSMEVCRRNQVIFSCVCQQEEAMSEAGELFVTKLGCTVLSTLSLRAQADSIPTLMNLYLSQLNPSLDRQIAGIDEQGMRLLKSYSWPHNLSQLKRLVYELAVVSEGSIINSETVRQALEKEKASLSAATKTVEAPQPLDLSRSLAEIERDIVRRVVEDTGGNQSAAAKRLGISRTTLWRMVQAETAE